MLKVFLLFAVGSCVGSGIYCCAYEWVSERQNWWRRSLCDNCQAQIKTIDLIPVVSAMILKFRCRYCNKKFSYRYWWVEIISGILFVLIPYQSNYSLFLYLIWIFGFMMAICDLIAGWVPDSLQLLLLCSCLIYQVPLTFLMSVIWSCGLFAILFLLYQFLPHYLGGADVKILTTLSLLFSPLMLPTFFVIAGSLGLGHVTLLWRQKGICPKSIPFVPSVVLAAFILKLLPAF